MEIFITRLIKEKDQVRTVECIGCDRCVNICPKKALEIHDVRNFVQNFRSPRKAQAEAISIKTTD